MASPAQRHEFEQTPGDGEGQRRWSMLSQRVGHDLTTEQQHVAGSYWIGKHW